MTELVGQDFIDFELPFVSKSGLEKYHLADSVNNRNVILAFFPAAWTGVCTKEMCTFRDSLTEFNTLNAEVIGISVDMPWALNKFKEDLNLNFKLVSDADKQLIVKYDVVWKNFVNLGVNVANRAIFVIKAGKIVYQWVGENPGKFPDFDAIKAVLTR